ncbi:MAG: hypothetical protein IPG80_01800 [Anaerolineales bacterium]|uniref:hypothetical protein n=1 Tax=Candidatus Villigracilis vicinus TaxID=3140679 RepID=UPI0031358F78|nr:hypothetical protein [Anaerolineales bacterium]MBK7448992.1 hypothetical protein [Anaerolineales bacterium]MBK9780730.1 hypothetical protein [Anaerolineales bacterium]
MMPSIRAWFTFVVLCLILSACLPAAETPEPTPTRTVTLTPIDTPTNTFTPTPRPSATIVRISTQDLNQPTFTPFVIYVDGKTITPFRTPTSSSPGAGFLSITYSPKKIYWGGCTPNFVSITARVEDPEEVFSVLIFTRVKDIKDEDYTPWTNGNVMLDRGQGEFTHKIIGSELDGHDHYLRSWVYFQLVATNIEGEEIGRSKIFEKAFEMYPCPCLTPLKGCPVTTPKPKTTPTPKTKKP